MIKKIDIYISKIINQTANKSQFSTIVLKLITHTSSGKIYPIYALIIPFIIADGLLIVKTGLLGFGFQVPIYIISKNFIKRLRPSAKLGITQIINPPDKYSFPSGHCASSMLLALIFIKYIPSLATYLLSWTCIIFISRIGLGIHYLSDAIAGIFLGVLSFYIANNAADIFLM